MERRPMIPRRVKLFGAAGIISIAGALGFSTQRTTSSELGTVVATQVTGPQINWDRRDDAVFVVSTLNPLRDNNGNNLVETHRIDNKVTWYKVWEKQIKKIKRIKKNEKMKKIKKNELINNYLIIEVQGKYLNQPGRAFDEFSYSIGTSHPTTIFVRNDRKDFNSFVNPQNHSYKLVGSYPTTLPDPSMNYTIK